MLGLWAPKRGINHIHLTGQKQYVTEQKWIWPVIVTEDYPKIISSPALSNWITEKKTKSTQTHPSPPTPKPNPLIPTHPSAEKEKGPVYQRLPQMKWDYL